MRWIFGSEGEEPIDFLGGVFRTILARIVDDSSAAAPQSRDAFIAPLRAFCCDEVGTAAVSFDVQSQFLAFRFNPEFLGKFEPF